MRSRLNRRAAAILFGALSPAAVYGQTWTGNTNANWATGTNWVGLTAPTSAAGTVLTFGGSTNYTTTNNIAGTFLLNQLTFAATATSPYTMSGNALEFRTSGVGPKLQMLSTPNASVSNPLTLNTASLDVQVQGNGVLTLSGLIGGTGALNKSGTGTLLLAGSVLNTFAGGAEVVGGTLGLVSPIAIPSGKNLTIDTGATARIDYDSGSNGAAPLGGLNLLGGTFRVPSGAGDYYTAGILTSSGGAIDFTGSSNFWLHLTGAGIVASADAVWTGSAGTSRIQNDSMAPTGISVASGKLLRSFIPLAKGNNNQGFVIQGAGTYKQAGGGIDADVVVDTAKFYFVDPAQLATGTLTLQNAGQLVFDNVGGATLAKNVALGTGGGEIFGLTSALTMSGIISGVAGAPLVTAGQVTLTGNNTYTGRTEIVNGTLSVDSIPNGGVAGRLGQSSSASSNFVIGSATLRYTGASATTDRGLTLSQDDAKVNVSNAATNLTVSGQISGTGNLAKEGPGTLTLTSASNNWSAFATVVNGGALVLTTATGIPGSSYLYVNAGAELRLGFASGDNSASRMLTLQLNGGTLRVPAGSADYFINQLKSLNGGVVDFSGSTNFWLHLDGAGTLVQTTANATWIGGGASNIRNDSASMIDFNIASGTTLTNGIPLKFGGGLQGFNLTGGGTLVPTAAGSDAPINISGLSRLRYADPSYITAGALSVQDQSILEYNGAGTATLNKAIALTGGGAVLSSIGGEMTFSGAISGAAPLFVAGPIVLSGNNTYTGTTVIFPNTTLSVASIPNGGVVGPLGQSSASANSLQIGGTLRYTGVTATSDRGFELATTISAIDIANSGTNLTITGQITNTGPLTKKGPGTLTLTNTANGYSNVTSIEAGKLAINGGSGIIPAGKNVSVSAGGTFELGANVANFPAPIGLVTLNGGTLRVPAGSSDYYINSLASQNGGAIDFSGSSNFWLHLINNGAQLSSSGDVTWTGGGSSRIQNDNTSMADFFTSPTDILSNGIPLAIGAGNQGFRIRNGNLKQTAPGSTAPLIFDQAVYMLPDVANVTSGPLTLQNFGAIIYQGAGAATLNKNINIGSDLVTISAPSGALTYSGVISESVPGCTLRVSGQVLFTASPTYTGQTLVQSGTFTVAANFTKSSAISLNNSKMVLAANGNRAIKTGSVSFNSSFDAATLDLKDNKLILTAQAVGTLSGGNYTGVTGLIQSGYNGGGWTGTNGIITSLSNATSNNDFTSLGIGKGSDVLGIGNTQTGVWGGQTVTGSSTLVMYTYGGDSNLDGLVDILDYGQIDGAINANLSSPGWFNGDFNYDGIVDILDYGVIDGTINTQGGAFPTAEGLSPVGSVVNAVAVPEPAALGGVLVALLVGRRVRRRV